jgi:membrane associated rhomboid family serine protease
MAKFLRQPMRAINLMLYILLIMYAVQLINVFTNGALRGFGIYPRNIQGLVGIICSPFIHGNWWHLINNTVGFVIFSALCLTRGSRFYLRASLIIIFVGGLLVWIFGRQAVHIGASGWIFGLWSLSITLAWFERSVVNILISIAVIAFYGGMIWGVLPANSYISFEAHAFGALAGVLAAARLGKRQRQLRWS